MKRIIKVILIVLLAFSFTGCSKNSVNDLKKGDKEKIVIKDSGWTYYQSDLGNYFSYGFEITNLNKDYLAGFPIVKVVGRDENNKILFSYEDNLDYIYPNETLYYGDTLPVESAKPVSVEFNVNISDSDWENAKGVNYPKNNEFPVTNISEYKEYDDLKFTGEIENKSNTDIQAASIVVIFKKDGKIVGGDNTYSDELDSKQKDTFEIYTFDPPEYDSYNFSSHVSMIN